MGEQNIQTPMVNNETANEKTVESLKIEASPAVITMPENVVAEAIESRLTTAENEVVKESGDIADRLLTVKSLVTLALAACFVYLSAIGKIDTEQYMTVFTTVIAFYFGVQTVKGKE